MLAELEAAAARRSRPARAKRPLRAERQKHADDGRARHGSGRPTLARPAGAGTIASAAQPRGQLTAPVAGTIVRPGAMPPTAGPATGISYRAPPAARVVSPCGGRVVFAAPFRSYGLLLIVDCGGGYHAVLAGFDRLDVKVGQSGRGRRAGRRHAGLGTRRGRQPPGAVCRAAARRAAGEPGALAEEPAVKLSYT